MGASTIGPQRPPPFPDPLPQSTRYYSSYASDIMNSMPNDGRLGARPPSPLTAGPAPSRPQPPSLAPAITHLSSDPESARDARAPRSSILTASGGVPDPFAQPPGGHAGSPNPSQPGGSSLWGHMTGSWPTPGLSQQHSAYTYGTSGSTGPGPSGPLAPPPYNRAAAATAGPPYGSAQPSPSQHHFPGRSASSASNPESQPQQPQPPTPYQEQQGFPSPLGVGGAGTGPGAPGGLGSPLNAPAGNTSSGLSHPYLAATRQTSSGQSATGQGQGSSAGPGPEGASYRPPPPPSSGNYYQQTSTQPQQQTSFPAYVSSATQPPQPHSIAPATTSGSLSRSGSIPALAAAGAPVTPSLQYSTGPGRPTMGPYAPYSSVPGPGGPILSNLHNPHGPLSLVGGPGPTLSSYSHHHHPHHPLSHHPHHHSLYMHHPAQPPTPPAERPFKCTESGCMQAFNRNHDLKRHQRIHLAVKPFGCEDCEKRFSRKDALKRHRLVKGCGSNIHGSSSNSATGRDGTSTTTTTTTNTNTSTTNLESDKGQGLLAPLKKEP
ncbi:hypothetical protein VTJ83DRAFT_1707 [Remersonia thermophila]|uniref:C2H2-type domain-containing protein n=1 Tax=Remersonia thermophila TaxID=72144 RepID=A0ABR4DGP2_9PEZI